MPDENTLVFSSFNGDRHAVVVTPRVRTVVRNQFDCQSMIGAPLENDPTSDSCTGSHWEERFFNYDTMSATQTSRLPTALSPLTLALLEDSGWYKANYDMSDMSTFGLGAGCPFVEESCIVSDEVPDYGRGYFCAEDQAFGCSAELSHKMACSTEGLGK